MSSRGATHYVWLMGGLGNVLYQKYAGHVLASLGARVLYEPFLTQRSLITRLAGWTIHDSAYRGQLFGPREMGGCGRWPVLVAYLSKMTGVGSGFAAFLSGPQLISGRTMPTHLFGYFQERSFIEQTDTLFRAFCDAHRGLWRSEGAAHVMHMRLGDSRWGASSADYYRAALESVDVDQLLVLTDSPHRADQLLKSVRPRSAVVLKSASVLEDFAMMCAAETLIMAPSTLSWWAAHLSTGLRELWLPQAWAERCGVFVPGHIALKRL